MRIGFANPAPQRLTLEHSFEVNPLHGSVSLSVPLRASPGRNGFQPALSLTYGAGGNSVFGIGWFLTGLASIGIDTSRHDPTFATTTERYNFSGGMALVAALDQQPDGSWLPVTETRDGFRVEHFRSSTERSFERFEKWTDPANGRIHWRAYARNGVVSIFGLAADNSSRIADPANPEQRTFQWLLEAQYEPRGNAIRFVYKPEDGAGIDPELSFESRRARSKAGFSQRYLKRILYGNSKPLKLGQAEPSDNVWHFEMVFDFGEHGIASPSSEDSNPWLMRPDPFSTFRPGFELRSYRLCRRVLMFHRFTELGAPARLIGATELSHRPDPAGTTLEELVYRGYRTDLADNNLTNRTTTPIRVTYSQPEVGAAFESIGAIENLPIGVDGGLYQWIDLRNEGLPGILHRQSQSWYYKANMGGGRFAPSELVDRIPAAVSAAFQLADSDGDGRNSFSSIEGREAGGYVRDRDGGDWAGYQTLRKLPRIDLANARVQWADLNGDGYPDLLIDRGDSIVWYRSDGPDAFADPDEIARPDQQAGGAPTLSASARLNTFFADMTGDGRPDLVRIENGRVEYWPQICGATFGPSVVMESAPLIDDFGQLDPTRLRMVDLDGSGCASLLYIGRGVLRLWINRSGNSFGPERRITNLPYIDNASSAQVFDFLGDGTRCLVWSSPLPSAQGQAIQHLRLSGALPPRLLLGIESGCGQQTQVEYRCSAQDYLRDKISETPWHGRIPNHRMVVGSLIGQDHVAGTTVVNRYEYRHGYFDNDERRFSGFGRVDIYDTDLSRAGGEAAPAENSPPSLIRTWHHQGAANGFEQRAEEFYQADAAAVRLPIPQIENIAELSTEEQIEALRAIAGTSWRQEIYAIEANGTRAVHPLRVTENSYRIRCLQPTRSKNDAVFAAVQSEALAWNYDEDPSDPRVTHDLALDPDDFGNVTRRLALAYPRRRTAGGIVQGQEQLHATLTETTFLNFDRIDRFEVGIELQQRRSALHGMPLPVAGVYERDALLVQLAVALADRLEFHELPDGVLPQAQLTGLHRNRFWSDDRSVVLPPGQIGAVGLLHKIETAVYPDAAIAAAFEGRVDAAMMSGEARMTLTDGYWWASDQHFTYAPPTHFLRLASESSPGGARQTLTFDDHDLLVVAIEDVFGNRVASEPDYQVLASGRIIDANGNISETRYDPLGFSFVTALHGEQLGEDGLPHPVGAEPLTAYVDNPGFTFAEILADPGRFLQNASRFFHFDINAFADGDGPARSIYLERECHFHDGEGGSAPASQIRITIGYFDGLLNPVQSKVAAGPGLAIQRNAAGVVMLSGDGQPLLSDIAERWLAGGHEVLNNKGWLVRRYEPWFSDSAGFESDLALRQYGVSTRTSYDAIGRAIRQDFPDGSFASATFSPWQVQRSDANDTVSGSAYEAARLALPIGNPERDALEKALVHARTPTIVDNDPLGREIHVREIGLGGVDRRTAITLGVMGQPIANTDPRGLTALAYRHDMLGRTLHEFSVDAGERWTLFDCHGRLIHRWDSNGHHHAFGFDANGRSTSIRISGPAGLDALVEELRYGDDPGEPQAQLRNLRGKLVEHRDEAGVVRIERYHMDGQSLTTNRRLFAAAEAVRRVIDWRDSAQTHLQAERFASVQRIDALGRPMVRMLPDGTTREYGYARLGHLADLRLTTADGTIDQQAIVSGVTANARGQPVRIGYGNGVETLYDHDRETFRLTRLRARRIAGDGRVYQDIGYSYDPVGNITRFNDASQEPGAGIPVIAGLAVSPACEFTYDAWYRLIRATGRVHQALLEHDYRGDLTDPDAMKSTRHIGFNNGAAVERYARTYDYDLSGNLVRLRHQGASHNWTTDYWTSPNSNRTIPAKDLGGIAWANPESHFDPNGNTIRLAHLRRLDWNHNNRLVRAVAIDRSASGQSDDAEYYVYGGDGKRVRRVTERLLAGGVETTETIFLDGCEIRRINLGGTLRLERLTSHLADGSRQVATLHQWTVDQAARETDDVAAKKLHYLIGNHLGSVSLELDETGAVISYEEYFPYGGTSFVAGRSAREVRLKDLRYCGKCRDDMTGLYCFEFRHYAPFIGNWLSPDPIGPTDGLNLYCFVHNNPIVFIDPLGLDSIKLASGPTGMTEAQAIGYYNWSVAYQEGMRITDLRRGTAAERGAGMDWILVAARPLTASERTAIATLRERGVDRAEVGEALIPLFEALDGIDTRSLTNPPTGTETGSGATEGGGTTGGNAGSGVNAGDGTGADGGTGTGAEPDPATGSGTGTTGTGTGSGTAGTGTGGGGTATTPGTGTGAGTGTGTGSGGGSGSGTGSTGRGSSGTGSGGTGGAAGGEAGGEPGGRAGGRRGGTGTGDPDPNNTGGTGTDPGGTSTAPPPPNVPISPDGIAWTADMVPPEVNPASGTPTTDPSQTHAGIPGGDPRGTPGSEGSGGSSASGSGGTGSEGSGGTSGESNGTGGSGSRGAPGGTANGREGGQAGGSEGGIIGGQGWLSLPSWLASPINTVIEHGGAILDVVQVGLDIIGLIPGLGEIADGINGLISLARGDYSGAALSFAAMIPFAGWAATAGKFGRRAVRGAEVAGTALRYSDEAASLGRNVLRHGDEAASIGNAVLKNSDEAAQVVAKSADELAGVGTRTAGGSATVHYHGTPKEPHFTIETDVPGAGRLETHQVIDGAGTEVMEVGRRDFPGGPADSRTLDLANPDAARAVQEAQLGAGNLGEWSRKTNSCATTVCDVLRAGGAAVPSNANEAGNFLRYMFGLSPHPKLPPWPPVP